MMQSEIERILSLGCSDYVDLDFWPDRWQQLNGRIHVRVYERGQLNSEYDYKLVKAFLDFYPNICTIRIRNETNIECTGDLSAYLDDYLSRFEDKYICRLSLPALSPGINGWQDQLNIIVEKAYNYGLDNIDAHVYGPVPLCNSILNEYSNRWKRNILVTEYNFGAGNTYSLEQWARDYKELMSVIRQYDVKFLAPFIWEWENPDMVLPTPVNIKDTIMENEIKQLEAASEPDLPLDYSSPNNSGTRFETRLIILHGSRSGKNVDLDTEFVSTVRHLNNPTSDASSHYVFGVDRVARPVHPDLIAWHAGLANNKISLGYEIVQPLITSLIPTSIQVACAKQVARDCIKYHIPVQWSTYRGICEHKDTAQGQAQGKTDIGTLDRTKFLALVRQYYSEYTQPVGLSEQRKVELRVLPSWYLACVAANEDWTKKTRDDFIDHLKGIGGDFTNPERYGWK